MLSTFKRITQRSGGANPTSDSAQEVKLGDAFKDVGESECWLIIKVQSCADQN
jgi:hypothetical protein